MAGLCLCGAVPLRAADPEPNAAEATLPEPVHFELLNEYHSTPLPDGNDVLTCTGGFSATQRWQDEDALLELRAENAVLFYSQKEVLKKLIASSKDAAPDAPPASPSAPTTPQSTSAYPQGVYLEGDVTLHVDRTQYASDIKITADRLYYDFVRRAAIILDATMRLCLPENQFPLYVRAGRLQQWSRDRFTAEKIKLSNDEFHQPHFWIGAEKLDLRLIELGQKKDSAPARRRFQFDVRDITLNLEDLPFFWWPRGVGTTGKTESPLQSLHTGVNSEYGIALESQWNPAWLLGLAEPPGVKSTLRLDEFTERGPAGGLETDYTADDFFGRLRTYLIGDRGEDRLGRFDSRKNVPVDHNTRGRARWQHRHYLPYHWQANFEISYLSDRNFLESWEEREFDVDPAQDTLVYLKQQRDNWAFDFTGKFHLNDFDYTLTELPAAGLHGAGQDLFETFTYYHDSYISRQAQRAGDRRVPDFTPMEQPSILPGAIDQHDFAFATSRHELNLPLHLGPWNLMPTAIGTFVHDESGFNTGFLDDPRYERSPRRDSFLHGAVGVRLSTRLARVDDTVHSRVADLDRLRHVIVPEIGAFWIDSDQPDDRLTHDVFHFALRQRWQTWRGPKEKKHQTDVLRLNTSVTLVTDDVDDALLPGKFFFDRPEGQFDTPAILHDDLANLGLARRTEFNQNLSDHADADWTWLISDTTAFTGAFNYNIHDAVISQTSAAFAVQRSPRTRYYVGHRFLKNGDLFRDRNAQFLTAGMSYRLNRKYVLSLTQQYDIEQTAAAYNRLTIIRKFPHWYAAFTIGHDSTRGGVSFTLTLWPEGFDDFILGSRRVTRLAP